jgi:methyl-accepting chemotaxis protein
MTGGFLGSKGERFASELPAQRNASDQRLAELQAALQAFDRGAYPPVLNRALDAAERNLRDLDATRVPSAAWGSVARKPLGYYTRTIGSLLAVGRQGMLLSDDREVTRLATAYSNFSHAKERAGIERALLNIVFGANRFSTDLLARFLANAAGQNVYLHEFEVAAGDEQKQFYRQKVTGREVAEAERMKQLAMEGLDGRPLGVERRSVVRDDHCQDQPAQGRGGPAGRDLLP